jgi:hypothetical protein
MAGLLMPSSVLFIPLSTIPRNVGGGGGTVPGGGGGACDVRVALFLPSPSKTSRSDPALLFTAISPVSCARDKRGFCPAREIVASVLVTRERPASLWKCSTRVSVH